MSAQTSSRQTLILGVILALVAGAGGYGLAKLGVKPALTLPPAPAARQVLYWFDPMVPGQHFDKPGKSPFMDMQLVPKYADQAGGQGGVRIDPAQAQSLGVRLAVVTRGALPGGINAVGTIDFNERDLTVVQARSGGFVQRAYGHAPGDVVAAGAPLADILVPEWTGAQAEFLAVARSGNAALAAAARQRLSLLGMSAAQIARVAETGRTLTVATLTTPSGGVIRTLGVRAGMTVTAGQTLAEISGLDRVWLNAAVPEAATGAVRLGESVTAALAAYPGETFRGQVTAILPQADTASRTLTVRIELPNPGGRLRPGMFANVQFAGQAQSALLIPSEAVIRTGKRALVMIAHEGGRFEPAEVRTGREAGERIEILAGLSEGEKIVASGQFLIDSEASLSGVPARPISVLPAGAGKSAQ